MDTTETHSGMPFYKIFVLPRFGSTISTNFLCYLISVLISGQLPVDFICVVLDSHRLKSNGIQALDCYRSPGLGR